MAIRVVQLGTGNVGVHALKALITNPEFELTGVWVSSDAKAGKDAAELAGLADSTWTPCLPPVRNAPSTTRWPTTACPRR